MRQINVFFCCGCFFCERPFHWDKRVASLKVELVRYDVWQLRQSSGLRLNVSMSHSGRARQSPYGRWDGAWFPFVVLHMFWSYQSCDYSQVRRMYELVALRYSRQQTVVWADSITLSATAPSQKSYVWFFFARLCTKKTLYGNVALDLCFHVNTLKLLIVLSLIA